ncbi:MAG: hypothetical protein NW223_24125 [Hyphomicrobiaceae bacterium]|nr:hypothetical protein [Hyphomicrobiaceae bacterium]
MPHRAAPAILALLSLVVLHTHARADDTPAQWPPLKSTFPSTGGGGITIKGYDPVVVGDRCVTTFMAVTPGDAPQVYTNVAEFDAVAQDGGILCRNGRWRSFDGTQSGTTPFQVFLKDGVFRARP